MNGPKLNTKGQDLLLLLGFIVVMYFPIFLHLDSKPLREWDEARNAVNAYEMAESHNLLVKTFNHQPDLWETKPTLLIWLQAAGFGLFGTGEMAVRLPSALATFSLLLFLFFFFKKQFGAPSIGIFASLMLITSHGYLFEHCTRTGDHDALLVLFEILMLFNFYLYLQFRKNQHLLYFSLFLFLCIYTKSIACFLFLPGIFIYLLLSKQLLSSLKDKKLWLAFWGAIALAALYYALRENAAKGYLEAVWQNELFPRYFNTSDIYTYNPRDIWFYFKQLYEQQYTAWVILILPAIFLNEISSEAPLKKFHRFILVNAIVFFIVLSNGTTNSSYLLPLLPLLSIIIGMAFYNIGRLLLSQSDLQPKVKTVLVILLLLSVFYQPYTAVIEETIDKSDPNPQVQYAYVFRRMEREMPEVKHFAVFDPSAGNYPLVFYKKIFTQQKHYVIDDIYSEQVKDNKVPIVIFEEQLPKLQESGVAYKVLWKEHNSLLIRTGD